MAASDESCDGNPDFAVICSFITKFGNDCGVNVTIADLQQMLEDTKNVHEDLAELHIHLLRRGRKRVTKEKWERSLIKFCHEYSSVDAWELERFGYKKAKLSVKLELLKRLLELQFDSNAKFKSEVNKHEAHSLRIPPIGRDIDGQVYWYQLDREYNMRLYRQGAEEDGTWKLLCSNTDHLRNLLSNLQKNITTDQMPVDTPKVSPDDVDSTALKMETDGDDLTSRMSETKPNTIIIKTEKKEATPGAAKPAVKNDDEITLIEKETDAFTKTSPTDQLIEQDKEMDVSEVIVKKEVSPTLEEGVTPMEIDDCKPEKSGNEKTPGATSKSDVEMSDAEQVTNIKKAQVSPVVKDSILSSKSSQGDNKATEKLLKHTDNSSINKHPSIESVSVSEQSKSKDSSIEPPKDKAIPSETKSLPSKDVKEPSGVTSNIEEKVEAKYKGGKIKLYEKWSKEKKQAAVADAKQSLKEVTHQQQKGEKAVEQSSDGTLSKSKSILPSRASQSEEAPMDLSVSFRSDDAANKGPAESVASDLPRSKNVMVPDKTGRNHVSIGEKHPLTPSPEKKSTSPASETPRPFKKKHLSMTVEETTSDLSRKSVIFEVKSNKLLNQFQESGSDSTKKDDKIPTNSGFSHLQALQNMCNENPMTCFQSSVIRSGSPDKRLKTESSLPNFGLNSSEKPSYNEANCDNISQKYKFSSSQLSGDVKHFSENDVPPLLLKSNVQSSSDTTSKGTTSPQQKSTNVFKSSEVQDSISNSSKNILPSVSENLSKQSKDTECLESVSIITSGKCSPQKLKVDSEKVFTFKKHSRTNDHSVASIMEREYKEVSKPNVNESSDKCDNLKGIVDISKNSLQTADRGKVVANDKALNCFDEKSETVLPKKFSPQDLSESATKVDNNIDSETIKANSNVSNVALAQISSEETTRKVESSISIDTELKSTKIIGNEEADTSCNSGKTIQSSLVQSNTSSTKVESESATLETQSVSYSKLLTCETDGTFDTAESKNLNCDTSEKNKQCPTVASDSEQPDISSISKKCENSKDITTEVVSCNLTKEIAAIDTSIPLTSNPSKSDKKSVGSADCKNAPDTGSKDLQMAVESKADKVTVAPSKKNSDESSEEKSVPFLKTESIKTNPESCEELGKSISRKADSKNEKPLLVSESSETPAEPSTKTVKNSEKKVNDKHSIANIIDKKESGNKLTTNGEVDSKKEAKEPNVSSPIKSLSLEIENSSKQIELDSNNEVAKITKEESHEDGLEVLVKDQISVEEDVAPVEETNLSVKVNIDEGNRKEKLSKDKEKHPDSAKTDSSPCTSDKLSDPSAEKAGINTESEIVHEDIPTSPMKHVISATLKTTEQVTDSKQDTLDMTSSTVDSEKKSILDKSVEIFRGKPNEAASKSINSTITFDKNESKTTEEPKEKVEGSSKEKGKVSSKKEVEGPSKEKGEVSSKEKVEVSSKEKVEGSSKEKVEVSSKEKVELSSKEKVEGSSRGKVEGSSKEMVEGSSKEMVEGSSKEKVKVSSKEKVELSSKEKVEGSSKEKVEVSSKEKVELSSKEKVEGSSKEKGKVSSKKEVEVSSKEEMELSSKEKVEESPKEMVEISSKEKVEISSKEKVELSSKEKVEGSSKEKVEESPKEMVEISSKEKVELSSKEKVEGSSRGKVEGSSKEMVEGSSKEMVEGSSKEMVEISSKEKLELSSKKEVEESSKEKVELSSKTEVEESSKEKVEVSSKEKVGVSSKEKVEVSSKGKVEMSSKEITKPKDPETSSAKKDIKKPLELKATTDDKSTSLEAEGSVEENENVKISIDNVKGKECKNKESVETKDADDKDNASVVVKCPVKAEEQIPKKHGAKLEDISEVIPEKREDNIKKESSAKTTKGSKRKLSKSISKLKEQEISPESLKKLEKKDKAEHSKSPEKDKKGKDIKTLVSNDITNEDNCIDSSIGEKEPVSKKTPEKSETISIDSSKKKFDASLKTKIKINIKDPLGVYFVLHNTCLESKMRHPSFENLKKIPPLSLKSKPKLITTFSMDTTDDVHIIQSVIDTSPTKKKRGRLRQSKNPSPAGTKAIPTKTNSKSSPKTISSKKATIDASEEKDGFHIPEGFLEILSNTKSDGSAAKKEPQRKSRGRKLKISAPSLENSESESAPIKRSRRIQDIQQKKMSELAVEMEREQRILEQLAKKSAKKEVVPQKSPIKVKEPKLPRTPKPKFQPPAPEESASNTCLESKRTPRKMNSRSRNMTKMHLLYEDESKDSEFSTSRETEKSKKRRRGRGANGKKGFKPWDVSSESESTLEELTEEEEEEHEEPLVFEVNEDEFACEEVEEDAEPIVVRRARTAKKLPEGPNIEEIVVADDKPCLKCGKHDKPEWILLCDKCDSGYHTTCLIPPLMLIPEGDWYCQPCEHIFLCEWIQKELHKLEVVLKQRERDELRKQRLAYVGISLDNVLKPEKKEKSDESSREDDKEEDESEDEDSRDVRSSRRRERDRDSSSEEDRHKKLYGKRSVRARRTVNYQFKEYDELIASAIGDELVDVKPLEEQAGPKEVDDDEENDSDKAFQAKFPKQKKRKTTRLNDLDFSDDEDSGEEYKGSSATDSEQSAQPSVSGSDGGSAASGEWRIVRAKGKKPKRKKKRGRRDDSEEDWDDEEDSDTYRPITRRTTARKSISYREISSDDEWDPKPKAVKKRKKFTSSEDSEASYKKKKAKAAPKPKKKRVRKWASSDSSEESERSINFSDSSGSENKWKVKKTSEDSRLKININKKVLSSDDNDEESKESAPKKRPNKIVSDQEEEEESEEEEGDDEEEEGSSEEEEEDDDEEEEEDAKTSKPEVKAPKAEVKTPKPEVQVPKPEVKTPKPEVKDPNVEVKPSLQAKVTAKPDITRVAETHGVARKDSSVNVEPVKEKIVVSMVQDKPPVRTVKKDATKMVPCVIPYDKSPKSGHGTTPDEESDKEKESIQNTPKPATYAKSVPQQYLPKSVPKPPIGVITSTAAPLKPVTKTVPVPDRRPFTSSIVQPFSNLDEDIDSDDEVPLERIPTAVPNPLPAKPLAYERETKYTPAKELPGFTYTAPEEKCFPPTYSNLAPFQDYSSRPSPLKPSLVETYNRSSPSKLTPLDSYTQVGSVKGPYPLKPFLVETYNRSSPSKLTPLDSYSQSSSPKGFISLDSYSEARKKKQHFYGNPGTDQEIGPRPPPPDTYQREIGFPPEPTPFPPSPSTYHRSTPPHVQRDPGTPPRFHSQYPDGYAPPRSPEYYHNSQYYQGEERVSRPPYHPNYAPPEHGGPPYVPNPYVATPVPQPNGGFMIDTLLRARNPEDGEDELTGVTDIVSYITQE